ncbi:hypothetical protein [Flammeovirga pacifica]|uniref:Uncharacterized protein n=1 Tax=Flammeovirga pacifica TaxID=915059 RepID=A0A1S1YY89_FLAPC|nr:hypothetical protein [Flammeovirga pacifica]OHX65979.1 hypothetical protein NH26_06250 [Flammeovirga pacifica]
MSNRILLPNIRYIHGFKNKEERLIKRAFNDFYFLIESHHQNQNPVKFKSAYCVALTKTIMDADLLPEDADIESEINQRFPSIEADNIIEEIEIKFNDDDLLLLKLYYNHKIDTKSIGMRLDKSPVEINDRLEKLNRLWQQDLPLTEYLNQIYKREVFKSLDAMMIPVPQKTIKNGRTNTVGSITKVQRGFFNRIINLFK